MGEYVLVPLTPALSHRERVKNAGNSAACSIGSLSLWERVRVRG
jgi:hypothetical protein